MFDIGWIELLFIAAMMLVVVGPKDMPKLLNMLGRLFGRARRVYSDLFQGIRQLEQEVDVATRDASNDLNWHNHLPESIRDLPDDFVPGTMTAEQHRARQAEFERARQQASTPPPATQQPGDQRRD
ncbi:preprotein translocase subunit TatB [Exilibacterium tricleocarpae]|uniref:Preprotein translocase subunit TatB n=1 Tax=Exilibacterium tricleocarpae TaxID=2591008 RepID=A0A545ST52_9GAMM|nr:preprotein translocase subunit TatB [Exilibacterium tricleocarpae]TQV68143.1 preprotein translocase subunit TatB [Exilibacterium tricleocarpae]